jgi:hypothetical protein
MTSFHELSAVMPRSSSFVTLTSFLVRFFDEVLDHDLKFAPSFDYKIDGEQHEMDFGIISSKMLRPEVEMIFGESKSGMALKEPAAKMRSASGNLHCWSTGPLLFGPPSMHRPPLLRCRGRLAEYPVARPM